MFTRLLDGVDLGPSEVMEACFYWPFMPIFVLNLCVLYVLLRRLYICVAYICLFTVKKQV